MCSNTACVFLTIAMETWGQTHEFELQKYILPVQLTHFTKCKLKKVPFSMHREIASLRTAVKKKISVRTISGLYVQSTYWAVYLEQTVKPLKFCT